MRALQGRSPTRLALQGAWRYREGGAVIIKPDDYEALERIADAIEAAQDPFVATDPMKLATAAWAQIKVILAERQINAEMERNRIQRTIDQAERLYPSLRNGWISRKNLGNGSGLENRRP